jgi:hypothetical protein
VKEIALYKIKNWEKFNLYNPKNPRYQKKMTWFKFYGTDYINNIEIHKLSFEQKAVLVELWCLGSESDGILPDNFEISFRLHYPIEFIEKILDQLVTRGWLEQNYTPATIEKRREDKIREDICDEKLPSRFIEFWECYPKNSRKVGKSSCQEKWKSKRYDEVADKIISHVKIMSQSDQWKKDNGQYIPMPMTYLNRQYWDADIEPVKKVWEGGI